MVGTADADQDSAAGAGTENRNGMPLAGIRILEFGQYAAGPFGTLLLADWGAEVVKIEPPGGEDLRRWPPQVAGSEGSYSLNFASISRNKRSVTADLKNEKDRERIRQLIGKADVLLENFRPGVMDRLGFGYRDAIAVNPRLVYTSVSGYGHFGPYYGKGAFDIAIQGASGIMSITGEADGPPAKCGVPFADFCTGVFGALSCMVGLQSVRRTGKGCRMDVPMLSCMLACSALQTSEYWGTGTVPERMGSAHPRNAPYQAFRAGDGAYFIIAAGNDQLFGRLCDVIDRPELKTDPRFLSSESRAHHQKALEVLIEEALQARSADDWREVLDHEGVPSAPVLTYDQVLQDPQIQASGIVRPMPLPNGAETLTVGNPVRMSGYEFDIFQRPARIGEHNDLVVDEWLGDRNGW